MKSNILNKIKTLHPASNALIISVSIFSILAIVLAVKNNVITIPFALGSVPTLGLPDSVSIDLNSEFSVPVQLDTDGLDVVGIDLSLSFDPTKVQLISVRPIANQNTTLKFFGPLDESNNFDNSGIVSKANQTGKIELSAATVDMSTQQVLNSYSGATQLASLTFKAISAGTTSVNFVSSPSTTTDTNIVSTGNPPKDNLSDASQTHNLVLNINAPLPSPTITPVPTVTVSPTATVTPAPTKTATPTPTATVSPTKTPFPGSTSGNISINAEKDTYVNSSDSSRSYAAEKLLYVDGSPFRVAYLLFDLTALSSSDLENAHLSFKTTSAPYSGSPNSVDVYLVENTTWGENITYSTRPSISSTLLGHVLADNSNTRYDIELETSPIKQRFGHKFALAVVPTGDDALYFNSKESGIFTPQLTLDFPETPTNSLIEIHAAGTPSGDEYPTMELSIKGQPVAVFKNVRGDYSTRQFLVYGYNYEGDLEPGDVFVGFTNDTRTSQGDRNLIIDKVVINGVDHQSESDDTFGTGVWTRDAGCTEGFYKTEWLYCNGGFYY